MLISYIQLIIELDNGLENIIYSGAPPSKRKVPSDTQDFQSLILKCLGRRVPTRLSIQTFNSQEIEKIFSKTPADKMDEPKHNADEKMDEPKHTVDPSPQSATIPKHSPDSSLASINFFSGNPTVEVADGILHIFKFQEKYLLEESESAPNYSATQPQTCHDTAKSSTDMPEQEAQPPLPSMLCMLGVPADIPLKDILGLLRPMSYVLLAAP
jgi:hypothetical protein